MRSLRPRAVFLALFLGLLVFGLSETGWLETWDARGYDMAVRARRPLPSSGRVVVVEIDDDSIQELGRWPWPRSVHAEFLRRLRERYHPAAVAFDLLFSEQEAAGSDNTLAAEIKTSGNVHLASYFSALPITQPQAVQGRLPFVTGTYTDEQAWRGKHFIGLQPPLPSLARVAQGVGHVNVFPETDGCVRRLPLVLDYNGTPYLSLLGTVLNDQLNPEHTPVSVTLGRSVSLGRSRLPIDEAGETWISFAPASDFPDGRPFRRFSYHRVFRGQAPAEELKDKIILVGFGATGMADIHATPLSAGMLGVEINAFALDNLLKSSFVREAAWKPRFAFILFFSILAAWAAACWPLAAGLTTLFLAPVLGWILSAWLLSAHGSWLGIAPAGFATLAGYIGGAALRFRESERESLRITASVDTLALATRLIGAARRREDLYNEIRAQVNDALGALQTNLYLLNDAGDRLVLSLPALTDRAPVSYALSEGTVGWVAQDSSAHLVVHIPPGSTLAAELARSVSFPVGSAAYAPMSSRGQLFGVIEAIRTPAQLPFVRRHLSVLEAIATEAAVALENVALYEKLEGRVEIANRRLLSAYQDLKEERDRISAIVSNMADGVILTDAQQRIVFVNPAAEVMFGLDATALQGRPAGEMLPHQALLHQLEGLSEPPSGIPRIQLEQPRHTVLSPRTARLTLPDGSPAGAVTVLSDITLLEELSEMKTEFVSVVSHELRTPLTSIMGFAQTLRSDQIPVEEGEQEEFLGIIEQEANRLLVMINDLLDVSRMEAGRPLPLNYAEVDLVKLAEHVVRFQSVTTTSHTFRFDFPAAGLTVTADRDKSEQMLTNLVSNAIKYSPQGGEIVLGGKAENGNRVLYVRDQGLGIAPEQLGQLFERYQRIDRDAIKGIRGTGLGLFLVKALVEAHGGRVWVESTVGTGSTFFLSLPEKPPASV